jgi:hypothetical protein
MILINPTHKLPYHTIQMLTFPSVDGRETRVLGAGRRVQEISPERLPTLEST